VKTSVKKEKREDDCFLGRITKWTEGKKVVGQGRWAVPDETGSREKRTVSKGGSSAQRRFSMWI